jgi:hypothetical protein
MIAGRGRDHAETKDSQWVLDRRSLHTGSVDEATVVLCVLVERRPLECFARRDACFVLLSLTLSLSIYLSVCLSVYLSVCLSISSCMSV